MRKNISIIAIMVMVMFVSFNSIAFAGNDKNTAINPAGNNANSNGKASWKQDQNNRHQNQHQNRHGWKVQAEECSSINIELQYQVSELEIENDALIDENNSLTDRIAELEKQLADAQSNAIPQGVILGSAPVEEIHKAESRKFAISKYSDGNFGIYTNDFMMSDEAKSKLNDMVPGFYHIEVKVINVDSGIEVKIETDTEAFDFVKPGYDWFIGKTING